MRRVREDQFQRGVDAALTRRLRDLRDPPSQRELADREARTQAILRDMPSAPRGKIM